MITVPADEKLRRLPALYGAEDEEEQAYAHHAEDNAHDGSRPRAVPAEQTGKS